MLQWGLHGTGKCGLKSLSCTEGEMGSGPLTHHLQWKKELTKRTKDHLAGNKYYLLLSEVELRTSPGLMSDSW